MEPPASLQAFLDDTNVKPFPLQEFIPLQELFAVLQSLIPLHEFIPKHLTLFVCPLAIAEVIGAAANPNAAAVAIAIPINFLLLMTNSF